MSMAWTPLHWCAHNGHLPMLQCLREQGADKGARVGDGMTPLHYATEDGRLPVVQYFEGLK